MAKKIYAVAIGRKTGIFTSWKKCKAQVKGFSRAKYKGFVSKEEALEWLKNPKLGKKPFYALNNGGDPVGIYESWEECQEEAGWCDEPEYKGFYLREAALEWQKIRAEEYMRRHSA